MKMELDQGYPEALFFSLINLNMILFNTNFYPKPLVKSKYLSGNKQLVVMFATNKIT